MTFLFRMLMIGLLLVMSMLPAVPAAGQAAPPEPFDCPPGLLSGEALPERVTCAFVTVPLDRSQPDGATIQLATARIAPATETDAPPLLVLNGGPGSPTLPLTELFTAPTVFSVAASEREVVLLDQRGVGLSIPALDCPEVQEVAPTTDSDEAVAATVEALGACRDHLVEQGRRLGAYNTTENAADVSAVVEAFGYDTVDLYGVSYGTSLALQVAESQPAWLRTLTLDSPIDPTANFITDVAGSFDQVLDLTDEACSVVPTCGTGDSPLSTVLTEAVESLNAEPLSISIPAGPSGEVLDLPLTGTAATNLVFLTYYNPELLRQLPRLVQAFAERDAAFIAQLLGPLLQQQPSAGVALGMQLSVLCAEEVAASSPADVLAAAADLRPIVRDVWLPHQPIVGLPVFDVCDRWDVPSAAAERFGPVALSVPTLVAVGSYDHITPPRYGEAVVAAADDATLVTFTDMGHSPMLLSGPCGLGLLVDFLNDPSAALAAGCAQDPSPFAPRTTSRISGADRVGTAVAASQQRFDDAAAGGVVLAASGSFPDALTGAPLAVDLDAPLLLTPGGGVEGAALHPAVVEELLRVLPESGTVTVLGGSAALPEEVEVALAGLGFSTERIAGADRYGTAVAIAERIGSPAGVVLATGTDFADPLVAAPLAAAQGCALLLTAGEELPAATAAYLDTVDAGAAVLAVGGPAATAAPDAEKLVGADRYATAAAVAERFFAGARVAGVASGTAFADAATGGAHIAAMGGPLLLTPPDRVALGTAYAIGTAPEVEQLFVYGGAAVIPELLLAAYDSAL